LGSIPTDASNVTQFVSAGGIDLPGVAQMKSIGAAIESVLVNKAWRSVDQRLQLFETQASFVIAWSKP
jgi:hypothetical protein